LPSISRSALFLTLLSAGLSVAAGAPVKKAVKGKVAPRPAPAETVYVQVAAPVAAAPARSADPEPARESRRPERIFSGPARDAAQAYGAYAGFYNAEVLGSNPFGTLFWDIYPQGQSYFFQFTAGGGTVQSDFSRSVVGADEFEHNWLIALEALGGMTYSGLSKGAGRGAGLFPYFVAGITAVYQGGVPNVGGVVGFGNRMPMPFMAKNGPWALNYGLRDHIYSQKLRNEPSLTQNFVFLVGAQKYF
jgi:hypothetical protein